MKLFKKTRCAGCRQERWTARKRKLMTPIGIEATSKDALCDKCYKIVKSELSPEAPK